MAELFYSSDPHFFHENIIKFCGRPFENSRRMNEELVERHNAVVKPQDHWWCLGDLSMERGSLRSAQAQKLIRLVRSMNGHKRLILGNHDQFPVSVYLECGFEKIKAYHKHDGMMFVHIPIHAASIAKSRAIVHGHIHNNQGRDFKPVCRIDKTTQEVSWVPFINISVEVTDYTPVSLEWINDKVKKESR